MKTIKNSIGLLAVAAMLVCGSCAQEKTSDSDSGSDSQTTPNDSSGAESNRALGVDGDNQNDVPGYPSNQSNLNSDSTRMLHDVDTTKNGVTKDKPNKHL
ncbi:hypothetical protein L0657_06185 [Dyadobacter sp. CY345]|uniref:hypothetical protein n=1 Tax=Dyadobacter sp. CY345 TaxID=2909335 RepID=UPI001F15CB29|nr:hypothetical protein [Dyadobacter sp. CY345]MCF2443540.1 hypothetical protein [Dyadobacter sp. CY345]